DNAGYNTSTVDGLGKTTTMQFDPVGHLTTETDPNGNVTSFAFDSDGRQTLVTNPLGQKTTTAFDNGGRISTITDALGQQISYAYDNANHKTGETWKNSGGTTVNTLTYAYDAIGNMLTAANSAGTYTMGYDSDN